MPYKSYKTQAMLYTIQDTDTAQAAGSPLRTSHDSILTSNKFEDEVG